MLCLFRFAGIGITAAKRGIALTFSDYVFLLSKPVRTESTTAATSLVPSPLCRHTSGSVRVYAAAQSQRPVICGSTQPARFDPYRDMRGSSAARTTPARSSRTVSVRGLGQLG